MTQHEPDGIVSLRLRRSKSFAKRCAKSNSPWFV